MLDLVHQFGGFTVSKGVNRIEQICVVGLVNDWEEMWVGHVFAAGTVAREGFF